MRQPSISRRSFVSAAAAAAATAVSFPVPAFAQLRPVKFTLAFLAGPNAVYLYAGKEKGIFAKHGIDLDISRGYGSLAAAQAIAAGRFDFGNVGAVPLIVLNTKDLPLTGISVMGYESGMGVGVPADGPVKTPKDLAGKRIGDNPSSAEVPLFPAYAKLAGFDPKAVDLVNTDPNVLERVVFEKQLDGMTGIAQTSLPLFIQKNSAIRWMLYSSVGLPAYGPILSTTRTMIAKNASLCQAMADATEEAMAWSLVNSDEAMAIFTKQFPEMALTPDARAMLKIGKDINDLPVVSEEAKSHGIGYAAPAKLATMTDMVVKYVAEPNAKKIAPSTWFAPQFGGRVKIGAADWKTVEARTSAYAKYVG